MLKKRINLIPQENRATTTLPLERVALAAIVALSVLITVPTLTFYSQRKKAEATRNKLQATLTTLQSETVNLEPVQETGFPKEIGSLDSIVRNKRRWAEAFKELSALIPASVWIVNSSHLVEEGKRKVKITGLAASQEKVNDFFTALEESVNYRFVMIRLSEKTSGFYPQLFRFEFTAEMDDQNPKAASR
jgi:Tfp pilus assembly protein PilN